PARPAIIWMCMGLPDRGPRRRMRAAGPVSGPPGCLMPGSLSAAHGSRGGGVRAAVVCPWRVRATPYSLSLAGGQVSDFRRTAWVINDGTVAVRLIGDRPTRITQVRPGRRYELPTRRARNSHCDGTGRHDHVRLAKRLTGKGSWR